ncbi:hypothetical protein BGZ76_001889 [Entomortierella beljakovae]|nr:hypothetical protein BGZ76_001889 [Entomortierella beljakovae]
MLTNLGTYTNEQQEQIVLPLPMSAVYNKQQFISHFTSLHHNSTQPTLISQLLTDTIPNTSSEFWILYDDYNRPIACAAANTVLSDATVGYVGLFEAKTEEAGVLVLKAATSWLRTGGLRQFRPVRQILGPVNMTTWLQYRLRVDKDPQPSMSFEPTHPEFYQECFSKAGFVKAVDYYTNIFDIDQFLTGFENYSKNAPPEELGLGMQYWNTLDFSASLNPGRHPDLTYRDNVAKRIYDLSIEMFRGKDFFDESFSVENHRNIVLNDMISRSEVDDASLIDLSSFVVDAASGSGLGYIAAWMESDTLVLKTLGFVQRARKNKVFAVAIRETVRRAKEHWGCTKVACALINHDIASIAQKLVGKSIQHTYRLYMYQPKPTSVSAEQSQASNKALPKQPMASALDNGSAGVTPPSKQDNKGAQMNPNDQRPQRTHRSRQPGGRIVARL